MRNIVAPLIFSLSITLLAACGDTPDPDPTVEPVERYIVAVNQPLSYFARRLTDDSTDVRLLAPPASDPAEWLPTVEDVLLLQGAELVLLNGAGYEKWLDKVALSANRLVPTGDGFRDQWIVLSGEVTHSHGPGGEHAHGGYAFTTWMDMQLARRQAEAVARALIQRQPKKQDAIRENLVALLIDIDALDAGYSKQALRLQGRQLIYSHPVYQYFERAYNLPGTSLHWEPDVMPSEEEWQRVAAEANPGTLFIWEAKPGPAIATRLQALGLTLVVIDPAANAGEQDWLSTQQANIARLEQLP